MSWLIAAVCLLVLAASIKARDYAHAGLAFVVGAAFLSSRLAFDFLLPPADELGHAWYAYCAYFEIAMIVGAMIASTRSPASGVVAVLSMVAVWVHITTAEAFLAGGGPVWAAYPARIAWIQSAQLGAVVLFSRPAISAILSGIKRIQKRESSQWQARAAQ